ncbi:hypothetical protein Cri9333_0304 [Crinalium epipsammum PCC 9333]|uniref:Transposase n=1 Tax=Crinalium epipsammum PCC 9333 TaxID=1173022 RepID=K9VUP9_9CYAN|nr:hypothetical protein Cri9333_0304 [Crinalium epipsammum PCC 9333]
MCGSCGSSEIVAYDCEEMVMDKGRPVVSWNVENKIGRVLKNYSRDLSDAEWLIIQPLLPKPKGFGHPVKVDLPEIFKGINY